MTKKQMQVLIDELRSDKHHALDRLKDLRRYLSLPKFDEVDPTVQVSDVLKRISEPMSLLLPDETPMDRELVFEVGLVTFTIRSPHDWMTRVAENDVRYSLSIGATPEKAVQTARWKAEANEAQVTIEMV